MRSHVPAVDACDGAQSVVCREHVARRRLLTAWATHHARIYVTYVCIYVCVICVRGAGAYVCVYYAVVGVRKFGLAAISGVCVCLSVTGAAALAKGLATHRAPTIRPANGRHATRRPLPRINGHGFSTRYIISAAAGHISASLETSRFRMDYAICRLLNLSHNVCVEKLSSRFGI